MTKRTTKLELDAIIKKKIPKRYSLGDNLYFTIKPSGAMSFAIRYQINGKSDYKGLGGYDKVNNNLGIARAKCEEYRVQIKQGINPKIKEQQEFELKLSVKKLEDQKKIAPLLNMPINTSKALNQVGLIQKHLLNGKVL